MLAIFPFSPRLAAWLQDQFDRRGRIADAVIERRTW